MFGHLSVKSFYSFGCATAPVENICKRAAELDFKAIALTDVNGLYALGWFFQACKEYALIPIIGAEVRHASGRAVLLPLTRLGYSNLYHILSLRHLQKDFDLAAALIEWRNGLVVISDAFLLLQKIAGECGDENLYVELRPGRNRSEAINFSRKAGIPPLITNDVHFLEPQDYDLHVKWRAISLKKTIKTVPANELASTEAWLKSASQMKDEFASYPEALSNAECVAERCAAFRLQFDRPIFARYKSPEGKSPDEVLRDLAITAAQKKYLGAPQVMARLEKELDMI